VGVFIQNITVTIRSIREKLLLMAQEYQFSAIIARGTGVPSTAFIS
jgi:hypothetical protein